MQFKLKLKLTAVALFAGCTTRVVAWDAAAHEIVATIAQIHLLPSVLPTICAFLNHPSTNPDDPQCHLAHAAMWADEPRHNMHLSAPNHYIGGFCDHPPQKCAFPSSRGWRGMRGGTILDAIRNVTDILEDAVFDRNTRRAHMSVSQYDDANEAVKFLIHYMGDMHMPLQLTGRDRGGISAKVLFKGWLTNIRSLWDWLLIAEALLSVSREYSSPLASAKIEQALRGTVYPAYIRMIMKEGVLGKWRNEVPNWLACPAPTPSRAFSLSFPTSSDAILPTIRLVWQRLVGSVRTDTDDDVICPHYWAVPVHALNCDIVWPAALDEAPFNRTRLDGALGGPYLELDTPEYAGMISERWIVEKLLAQAGIRLAGVLNYLFADVKDAKAGRLSWSGRPHVDYKY
ncbi:phospholipase C/P1 nuclease domain-containing protein [Mycena pura]|uniref:Phospholipase C/P1 nuclease domain-containing protein n=1 Tax=Mycena pura TaxID=153505 RepID=A0AAD6VHB9_9AGAR|nr:phospholipase C/P1 nuclease domain-containing protein [Mycena pura]